MAPVLVPIAPRTDISDSPVISRRRQSKSRNGCITCKARRMKCDESKPTCQQCTRRRVVCGGYPKHLKWKPIAQSSNDRAPPMPRPQTHPTEDRLLNDLTYASTARTASAIPLQSSGQSPGDAIPLSDHSDFVDSLPIRDSKPDPARANVTNSETDHYADEEDLLDPSNTGEANGQQQFNVPSIAKNVHTISPSHTEHTEPIHFLMPDDLDESAQASLSFGNPAVLTDNSTEAFDDDDWNIYGLDVLLGLSTSAWEQGIEHSGEMAPPQQPEIPDPQNDDDTQTLYSQLQTSFVSHDMIQHLFENSTCDILSIREDRSRNPWRTLVWPLAAHYPALYHGLAAMACFHMSQVQPQLHMPALQHFEHSLEALSDPSDMPPEAIVATRLALGLAASWDHEKTSTVIEHTTAARALIRQVVSEGQISKGPAAQLSRFSFLANTCLYMDVIARLTCVDPESSNDNDFNTACSMLSSSIPSRQQLDPLMGCAITLFPMIGRLAELVGRVRKRTGKSNSPSIISKGSELRVDIESWTPALDLESAVELKSNLTDSIQTAEAYRWASLLLLRQTVPELPWRQSIWELASKSLVYLATIPLTSRTTIVQIFPLMLAGCEAFEDDDRDWVRDRWNLMSRRMVAGIVERCRETTVEVWRRRDEYEISHGLRQHAQQQMLPPEANNLLGEFTAGQDESMEPPATVASNCSTNELQPSELPDFPVSAAFKQGIDPVTRAGHLYYTVKGDLHCFGVMRDWDWQAFLG